MPTSGGSPERRHTMEKNTAPADIGSTIFETLKKELLDLTIKPGDLIAETETCERFAVTRPPVRAATPVATSHSVKMSPPCAMPRGFRLSLRSVTSTVAVPSSTSVRRRPLWRLKSS